jgi:hypothetical protein
MGTASLRLKNHRTISYDATISNLDIGGETRVIYQGKYQTPILVPCSKKTDYFPRFHGPRRKSHHACTPAWPRSSSRARAPLTLCHGAMQATSNARDTIAYGTKVVGGVSPGKGGTEHLGLPVLDSVREVR